jgi:hypothetical protein
MILLVVTFLLGIGRKGWLSPLVPLVVSVVLGVLSALGPGLTWLAIITTSGFFLDMMKTAVLYYLAYAAGEGVRALYDRATGLLLCPMPRVSMTSAGVMPANRAVRGKCKQSPTLSFGSVMKSIGGSR